MMYKYLFAFSLAFFSAFLSFAEAAIPAVVGSTLTAVQTDALAMVDLVWPFVMALFGAMLLIKIFKRAGNKI